MKHGLLIIAISMLIPSILLAQGDSTASTSSRTTQEVFITGGMSFPYLPTTFKVNFWSGQTFGAGFGLKFSPGSAGYSKVYAAAEYNLFKFDEQTYLSTVKSSPDSSILNNNPGFTASQRPVKVFTLSFNYQGTFTGLTDIVSPYFLIGIGYMYLSEPPLLTTPSSTLQTDGVTRSTLSWSVGFGLDFPITESIGAFVQGKSMLGNINDVTWQYFPVNLGVRYTLQ